MMECIINLENEVIEPIQQDTHVSSDIENTSKWNGYKLVGDNLNKNIVPRHK